MMALSQIICDYEKERFESFERKYKYYVLVYPYMKLLRIFQTTMFYQVQTTIGIKMFCYDYCTNEWTILTGSKKI